MTENFSRDLRGDLLSELSYQALYYIERLEANGVKARPNARNIPTQHLATLLRAAYCTRLAGTL